MRVPVLVGPTGVGKTAAATALAGLLPVEIVSADSRQVYRGLVIGTAAPTAAEQAAAPYHGVGFVDPRERYSAGRFARDAEVWLEAIAARGRTPLVVGGTGFYLRALFGGLFEERAGRPQGTVASPRVYAAVTPGIGAQGHAVITLSSGGAFLAEYPAGEGRVLFYAVEAGLSWSDFPMQGLFAPLLYRSVLYLASRAETPAVFTVGDPVMIHVHSVRQADGEGFVLVADVPHARVGD